MSDEPSVSHWIAGLKDHNEDAAQRLWDRYFQRLVLLAQSHLGIATHGGADAEDVAQSVFKSLCLGVEQGKFPRLADRFDLWRLLATMTANKSCELARRERTLKRGGGHVLDEAALANGKKIHNPLDELVSSEPTPEFVALMAEQLQCWLSQLNDVERTTAQFKLQGMSNQEIANQMGCAVRTVDRRLNAVRRIWTTPAARL